MKKIIIASLVMLVSVFSFAQEEVAKPELKPNRTYLVGGFGDNWFISAGVGGQVYFRGGLSKGSLFSDHLTPAFDIAIGKWFSPIMGVRLQASGFNAKGLVSTQTDYTSGTNDVDGMYKFGFGYFNLHGDFLFNLHSQFWRYNENRCYEMIPFLGFGLASTLKEGELHDMEFAASIGIINQFRLSPRWDANLELKAMIVNPRFDGVSVANQYLEGTAGITAGVSYKFGKEKEFKEGITPETLAEVENKAAQRENELQNENNNLKNSASDQQRRNDELNKALEQERQKNAMLQKENEDLKNRPQGTTASTAATQGTSAKGVKVFYEIGKTTLDDFNSANLEYLADMIKSSNRKYTITGYADSSTGSQSINEKLANKRAVNVYNLLVDTYGVNKDLLSIESSVVDPEGLAPEMVRMAEVK
jgi:outer membrane protein OmpA-like peptidoglycan-associated protein